MLGEPLRFLLDESVPDSVGVALRKHGHEVILLRDAASTGSPDPLVWATAERNEAILVAIDGDMLKAARRAKMSNSVYARVSLVQFKCDPLEAAARIGRELHLIETEWRIASPTKLRRLFIEIGASFIRIHRL